MSKKVCLMVLLALLFPVVLRADSESVSAKQVLAQDAESLASQLKDVSEAGQDRAARIWATAKRLETESRLAESSVEAVMRLGYWRRVLDQWQDVWMELQSLESGGGTMWGHFSARNDATLERFLAAQAKGLGAELADVEENVSLDVLALAKKRITKGKVLAKDMGRDIGKMSKDLFKRVEEMQSELHFSISGIRDAETRKAVNDWVVEKARREY